MLSAFNISNAPLLLASIFLFVCISILLVFVMAIRKKKDIDQDFMSQLRELSADETLEYDSYTDTGLIGKWNDFWGLRAIQAGLVSQSKTPEQVGLFIFILFVSIYGIVSLLFKNPGIGLVPLMIVIPMINGIISKRLKAKQKAFEDQIPSFLSTLKSNVQSGATPENALAAAIETTIDPLRSELYIAKSLIETGSFNVAIATLRERTQDDTLRFLCGCIELSSKVGSNLEEQITTIEGILESRRRLQRKLEIAISENEPLLYVSMALIPGLFMMMYFMSESSRKYWFKDLMSWIVFFGVCIVYGLGVFLTNLVIKKTGDFNE